MELGLCVDPRLERSWEDALDLAARNKITYIEPAGGGHVPKRYMDPVALAANDDALAAFHESIDSRGLRIAALGCYGNPIHPDEQRAKAAHEDFAAMCVVASKLGVERVTIISGVPAGGPRDRVPNWITPSVFADLENAYRWQWEERLIPYWRDACRIAEANGVTICMEPIPGFMVYSPQTFLRLREACGETLCASIDPSHLWWQGIDPMVAVEQLAGTIRFVQVKDVAFDQRRIARDGLFPGCHYDDWNARTWVYRAIGFGHSDQFWKDFLTALRRSGYDDVVAIEIEESFMTTDEALELSAQTVRRALPRQPIPAGNWFDGYEWTPASID